MATRLSAAWVVGFDGVDHVLHPEGEVVFEGDTIIHVGHGWRGPLDEDIDCGDALLSPGFVDLNALGDIDCTILRFDGPAGTRPDLAWSRSYAASRRRDVLALDDRVFGTVFALAQGLRSGVTTTLPVTSLLARAWGESEGEYHAIGRAALALGLRAYLGPTFRSAVNVVGPDGVGQIEDEDAGRRGLAAAIRFAEECEAHSSDLLHGLLVPSTIETCSPELIRDTAAAAEALGVPFRLHCCQSGRETELVWERSGKSSVTHLAELGALSPRALLPHGVNLGGPAADPDLVETDLALLAERGAVVVSCPLVQARNGRTLAPFGELLDRGIRVGLGTDTAPPDMLMNLQIGLAAARLTDAGDPPPGCAEYFRAATLGGADALGRSDLGRLAPGAKADFVAFALDDMAAAPVHDPIQALFLASPGGRARDVWVAGRHVVRNRHLPGIDEAGFTARAQRLFETLRAAYTERDAKSRPWPDLFPPTFPIRADAAGRIHARKTGRLQHAG